MTDTATTETAETTEATETAATETTETTATQTATEVVAAQTATQTTETKEVKPEDWRAGIQDEQVRAFADRHNSPADLAKAAFASRQQLSNALILPGKDATDEQRAEFHKKLGVPETAEGYEISLPEDLPEGLEIDDAAKARVEMVKAKMHAANAPPAAVQAAVDTYFEMLSTAHEAQQKAFADFHVKSKEELTKEWGADADRNFTFAKRAVAELGGEDVKAFMDKAVVDGMKLGDHPAMVKMFATLGRRMGSDSLHLSMTETETSEVNSRLDTIHSWQFGTVEEQAKYKSDEVQAELHALYARTTAGGSIVGAEGRSL